MRAQTHPCFQVLNNNWHLWLFSLLAIFASLSAWAYETTALSIRSSQDSDFRREESWKCLNKPHLFVIDRMPKNHFDRASQAPQVFPYMFQLQWVDRQKPLIVVLPGGPGGTSTIETPRFDDRFNEDLNLLRIDPRGTGCNNGGASYFPGDQMSTQQSVEDIAEVLKALDYPKVILYGSSYGTMTATLLAQKLESVGKSPHLVLLEGTVGRWFRKGETERGTLLVAEKLFNDISGLKEAFLRGDHLKRAHMEYWVQLLLGAGNHWDSAVNHLTELLGGKGNTLQEDIADVTRRLSSGRTAVNPDDPMKGYMHRKIRCGEIDPTSVFDASSESFEIKGDRLVAVPPVGGRTCQQLGFQPRRLFDAAEYQIRSPILYLQGEVDPQTHLFQASYHFNSQRSSVRKKMMVFRGRGHHILDDLRTCNEGFWTRLQNLNFNIEDILDERGLCRELRR